MAGSLNGVTLIGNLGEDPEVRNGQGGGKIGGGVSMPSTTHAAVSVVKDSFRMPRLRR
jgi:single-stranded DNA-binding protein